MDPVVTVSVVTYNHEQFISKALDSVLSQDTSFDYEVLVGDDDSTDGTREIIKEYKNRYPDRIRLELLDKNVASYGGGRSLPPGKWNFINNINKAKGKYIAYLEGDDYWTDQSKLQIQYDILESDENCSICYTNCKISTGGYRGPSQGEGYYDFPFVLRYNPFHASTAMFRRKIFQVIPEWFYKMPGWAYYLLVHAASKGDVFYKDICTAIYRIHDESYHSSLQVSERLEWGIKIRKNLVGEFSNYRKDIESRMISDRLRLAEIHADGGSTRMMLKELGLAGSRLFHSNMPFGRYCKRTYGALTSRLSTNHTY